MNAITQTEARAIKPAAAGSRRPDKNLILVPLSRLVPRRHGRNVRKTRACPFPNWPPSIQRVGLLQT